MAIRQVLFTQGLRNLTKQKNLEFIKQHQLSTNYVRYIRNRSSKGVKENSREYNNSTSPFEGYIQPPNYIKKDVLPKAVAFTVAFTAGSFISVTIWEYEKIRSKAINVLKKANPKNWLKKKPNAELIMSDLEIEIAKRKKEIEILWNRLTPGERIFTPILALNIIVFAMWRVPTLKPFLLRYFCSNPAAKTVCWPMFLSTFSHYSLFHLFANMYVLHSFSAAANSLGKEQFLGLYLSAGVIASLASYGFKIATANPGYSLGASGAIMAILAYVCAHFPETKLSILFIPQFQFSAGSAIQAIMCFDLAGIIFRWRVFDHAAHLGGAAVGLFWSIYGQSHLWPLREHFVGYWHQFRGKP